jgi:hypothetical protein
MWGVEFSRMSIQVQRRGESMGREKIDEENETNKQTANSTQHRIRATAEWEREVR